MYIAILESQYTLTDEEVKSRFTKTIGIRMTSPLIT